MSSLSSSLEHNKNDFSDARQVEAVLMMGVVRNVWPITDFLPTGMVRPGAAATQPMVFPAVPAPISSARDPGIGERTAILHGDGELRPLGDPVVDGAAPR
jgi:hypothetical protein